MELYPYVMCNYFPNIAVYCRIFSTEIIAENPLKINFTIGYTFI